MDIFWKIQLLAYLRKKNKNDKKTLQLINLEQLENLLREYSIAMLSKRYKPPRFKNVLMPEISGFVNYNVYNYIKSEMALSHNIVDPFIRGIISYHKKGVIPNRIYDPLGNKKKTDLINKGKTNILSQLISGMDNIVLLSIVAGGLYIVGKLKK